MYIDSVSNTIELKKFATYYGKQTEVQEHKFRIGNSKAGFWLWTKNHITVNTYFPIITTIIVMAENKT